MLYTVDMMTRAVEEARRSAADVARAKERERCCRIVASYAEMTSSDEARVAMWEAILKIRAEEHSP